MPLCAHTFKLQITAAIVNRYSSLPSPINPALFLLSLQTQIVAFVLLLERTQGETFKRMLMHANDTSALT